MMLSLTACSDTQKAQGFWELQKDIPEDTMKWYLEVGFGMIVVCALVVLTLWR